MDHRRLLRHRRRREAHALLIASALGCSAPPPPESPADAPGGHVVYVYGDEAGASLWRIGMTPVDDPHGEGDADLRVVNAPPRSFPGPPQPNGTGPWMPIVTVADDAAGHHESLHLVDPTSARMVSLGVTAEFVRNPVWTPDGTVLVFEASTHSFRDLYSISEKGGPTTRLTDAPNGSFEPAISPDGLSLAFGSSRDGNAEIYAQPFAGGPARRLTDDPGDDRAPAYRPDGARLAWLASRNGHPRVWTQASAGGDALALREGTGDDLHFVWSPDGRFIAVATQTAPNEVDLFVYDAVRGLQIGAFAETGVEEQPAWSPDSRWLAFAANRAGNTDLYVARPDGTALRRLTSGAEPDWLPRWFPKSP